MAAWWVIWLFAVKRNLGMLSSELPANALRLALFAGTAGCAVLWVAMAYFWWSFDRSGAYLKAFWLVLLALLGPVGAVLYHFIVYRPQTALADGVTANPSLRSG
jgi:hypothetical protein